MSESSEPLLLSTGQAARILGVHPSTVKRWFEDPSADESTEGGHRRIPLGDVLAEGDRRGHPSYLRDFGTEAALAWQAEVSLEGGDDEPLMELFYRWLRSGQPHLIGRFLLHLGTLNGLTAQLLDGAFGGCMRMVGEAWEQGRLRVGQERAASREVGEALILLVNAGGVREHAFGPARPAAVVGCMEGDHHSLGALMVRALLTVRGWNVEYLGGDVPVEEFIATQKARNAALVCVSFTPPLGVPDVRRCVDLLAGLMDPSRPFALAVGGGGTRGASLPDGTTPFTDLFHGESLVALEEWVATLREGGGRG